MRTWGYSINSRSDYLIGTVDLYLRPWYLSLIEWFAFAVSWKWLYNINLPNWPKISWDGSVEPCSPYEWWGSVGGLVHAYITVPLFTWVSRHPRNKCIEIKLGYFKVREIFYSFDPTFFDKEEAVGEEEEGSVESVKP